jgi:hypothetical protein
MEPPATFPESVAPAELPREQPGQEVTAPGIPPASELPAAAVVDQRGAEPPRRGWWSRFVRKDE